MPQGAESVANCFGDTAMTWGQGASGGGTLRPGEGGHLLTAYCRARGTRVRLAILNITINGCLLDLRSWSLRAGERVLIRLPGLTDLPAVLQWAEDGRGGLVFDQPLHEAVLRHLLHSSASRRGSLGEA